MFILYILILVSAIIGLSITFSIYKQKHRKQPLVCPLGANCHDVVNSDFSKFFGIGLEILGAAYYSFIITVYLLFLAAPSLATPISVFVVAGITIGGFLFSMYLTFVQAFLIKAWCSWCLMSAAISTAIFIFTLVSLSIDSHQLIPLLAEYKMILLFGHLIGFVFGVGGATMSDTLFFRFLKDFKISRTENAILRGASEFIWFGLFISILTGVGLFLPNSEALLANPKFLLKVIVVVIITINGAFLSLLISPKLVTIAWKNSGKNIKKTRNIRRAAFACGAISFISWYSALILGFVKTTPFSLVELLGIYFGALLIAVTGSQIAENILGRDFKSFKRK